MNEYDPSEIVDRLKKGGRISQSELNFVRTRLSNPTANDDLYDLMRALGLGIKPTSEDIALVEKFFFTETDDWILQGSIYTLCDYWGLTKNYLNRLLFFIRLENWASYPSAAIASAGALGDYLFDTKDALLFRSLLALYEHDMALYRVNAAEYNEQHLAAVYKALDVGVRGKSARIDHIKICIPQDISDDVIKHARDRAAKEK